MKRKKKLFFIVVPVLLILAAVALYGYKEYNRKVKDTASLKADFSVTADELLSVFSKDASSANQHYLDKVLSVSGSVKKVDHDEKGYYTVVLGDTNSLSSVRCSMDSVHNEEAAHLKKGGTVVLKGICTGFNADELLGTDVILYRSVLGK